MVSLGGNLPFCTHRYALFVSYLGARYKGSQRLINREATGIQDTVQEALEWSLEGLLPRKRCILTSCSRTDKGVNALMNCFSLPLMDFDIPTERMKHMANRRLLRAGHDILIKQVLLVPAGFHPRVAALSREYVYKLAVLKDTRSTSFVSRSNPEELMAMLPVTELNRVLPLANFDADKAHDVINILRGEHNFTSFALKVEDGEDGVREVEIDLVQKNELSFRSENSAPYDLYEVQVKSRSFLHNQVRRMVGAIISYASYNSTSLETIRNLLESPRKVWPSELTLAEPYGLYLSKINYHRSTFEGSLKTNENDADEKVSEFPVGLGMSEDPEDLARLCLKTL